MKNQALKKWIFIFASIAIGFLAHHILREQYSISLDKSYAFLLPLAFIFGMIYLLLTDRFSEFRNRAIGFGILGFFTVANAMIMGFLLFKGVIPATKVGANWYYLLIIVVFVVLNIKLTDWCEKLISKWLANHSRK